MKQFRFTCTAAGFGEIMGIPAVTLKDIEDHRPIDPEGVVGEPARPTASMHKCTHDRIPSGHLMFIDGDAGQCDAPVEEQDIVMILPDQEYLKIKCLPDPKDDTNYYLYLYDYDTSSEPAPCEADSSDTEGE